MAKSNYELFTKVVGRKSISRVGSRFVNRLDIPLADLQGRDLTEWIKLGITLPDGVSTSIGPYSLAVNFQHKTGVKVLVQSGIVDPALLEHVSINLDIEVFVDSNIPTHKDQIWNVTSRLRGN